MTAPSCSGGPLVEAVDLGLGSIQSGYRESAQPLPSLRVVSVGKKIRGPGKVPLPLQSIRTVWVPAASCSVTPAKEKDSLGLKSAAITKSLVKGVPSTTSRQVFTPTGTEPEPESAFPSAVA